MSYMENGKTHVRFASSRAALDFQGGMIGLTMPLDRDGCEELYLPMTGGRYTLNKP